VYEKRTRDITHSAPMVGHEFGGALAGAKV
jgi:hypothetical protein